MDGNHICLHPLFTDVHVLKDKVIEYEKALNLLEHHGIKKCASTNLIKLYHSSTSSVADNSEISQDHSEINLVDLNIICQGLVKLQTEKVVDTAVEMSQGCGRVSQKSLEVALNQHFDPTSTKRLLAYIQSVYGAPVCDDELKEWASTDGSILVKIIVHASTLKTMRTIIDVISKNGSILKSSMKLASHLKAVLQTSTETKEPVNKKRVHFIIKDMTQQPSFSKSTLNSKDNQRLPSRQGTPHKPPKSSRYGIASIGNCNKDSSNCGSVDSGSSSCGDSSSSSSNNSSESSNGSSSNASEGSSGA